LSKERREIVKRVVCVLLVGAVLLAFCATLALADDRNPPPWQRGSDRTTYQRWEFMSADPNPVPDERLNQYGTPATTVFGHEWYQYYDNRVGVWTLSGRIDVDIPNVPDHPDWTKLVWVQLTWAAVPAIPPDLIEITVDGYHGQIIESDVPTWNHTTWLFTLPYNPPWEHLSITGNIYVDELIVDTQCVPEPSSMLALASSVLGLAGLAWKRRR
jgi:hypothetical protein